MKIRHLDLDALTVNPEHAALGIPPIEYEITHAADHPVMKVVGWLIVTLLFSLLGYFAYRIFGGNGIAGGINLIQEALNDPMFWTAFAVGLIAQVIDGADLMPTPKGLAERGECWGPYRTYASLYLWRIADAATGQAAPTKRSQE